MMQVLLTFRTVATLALGCLTAYSIVAIPASAAFGVFGITAGLGVAALLVFVAQLQVFGASFGSGWLRAARTQILAPLLFASATIALAVGLDRAGTYGQSARTSILLAACLITLSAIFIIRQRP